MENKHTQTDNSRAVQVLEKNGFQVIQFIKQDNESFHADYLSFEADIFGCITAYQLLEKEGLLIRHCGLMVTMVDDVFEKPYGMVIFLSY